MPYRKRQRRSKSTYRRRGRRSVYRSKKVSRFIKKVVRNMAETKYAVKFFDFNGDPFSGVTQLLNPNIPQGIDKNQRIGNTIKYKFLQLRFSIGFVSPSDPFVNYFATTVRIIVWQPRSAYTIPSTPYLDSFLFTYTQQFRTGYSPVNNQNVRVLFDRLLPFSSVNLTTFLPPVRCFKLKTRINNNVSFASASDVIPKDPKDLYYITVIPHSNLEQTSMDIDGIIRISYVDV